MSAGWWAGKVRQTRRHLTGRVTAAEVAALTGWLTAPQMALFRSMPRADQRHGLDVVASLRGAGHADPELLLAGLLHDCGKGHSVRLWHRVAWSLGERYGTWIVSLTAHLPGSAPAFERIAVHADRSAELAVRAGCTARTAALIRHQAAPADRVQGEALRLADEQE